MSTPKANLRPVLTAVVLIGAIAAASALAENPYTKPDGSWISISGTVETVTRDAFLLDYGNGTVTVEMDDGDRDADAYKLLEGDKVTVYGAVDDDLFESTTIEASHVYVEKLGTYFYASAVDEEDDWFYYANDPIIVSEAAMQGRVTAVSDEEFKLFTGPRTVTVAVDEMAYNPLDGEGYQRIEVGDRVSVTGDMEYDLFSNREFVARSIIKLSD